MYGDTSQETVASCSGDLAQRTRAFEEGRLEGQFAGALQHSSFSKTAKKKGIHEGQFAGALQHTSLSKAVKKGSP